MNEAEEIQHLRRLVWNARNARARLRVDDPLRQAHVARLERFMKNIEQRKIVALPVTQTGMTPVVPYVSRYYRRMARLAAAAATAAACVVLVAGCKVLPRKGTEGTKPAGPVGASQILPLPTLPQNNLVAAAVAPPRRERWLMWDGDPEAVAFRVSTGPARGQYTNSFVVTSNRIALVSGVHYRIESLDYAGRLFPPALWPSNRIAELRLRDARGGDVPLLRYTNSPPGAGRFWAVTNNPTAYIADVTTGWN